MCFLQNKSIEGTQKSADRLKDFYFSKSFFICVFCSVVFSFLQEKEKKGGGGAGWNVEF